jgi:putative endonuclease
MYYVYFLQSEKDNKFYIGCSSRIPRVRLLEHNSGLVKSTRYRKPFKLVHFEKFLDRKLAFKREWYLKHPAGYQEKIKILKSLGL